jgi:hypothetical protein
MEFYSSYGTNKTVSILSNADGKDSKPPPKNELLKTLIIAILIMKIILKIINKYHNF